MSRTYKVNRWTYQKVPDKDASWHCSCSWCRCIAYHKALAKVHQQEVTQALSRFPYNYFTNYPCPNP